MWGFYVLLLVPLAIQHFTVGARDFDYQKKNQRALLFFFVVMTLLVALRHESVGTDTERYVFYFDRISSRNWNRLSQVSIELGYAYFNKLISLFTQDTTVYFAITAVITMAMIYPTYRRLCVDSSFTIALYVTMSTFVMAFSGIRQMLAIGIGMIAYEFTRTKKLIPFIICVALATTFHTSAFMLIFMYPLYYTKITRKWLFVVIPTLLILFVFSKQFFSIISLILSQFTEYDVTVTQTGAYSMLLVIASFVAFSYFVPDENYLDEETIGLRNFLLLSVVLQMFAPLHSIAMRMNYYYIIFIPLLLPKIVKAKSERWSQAASIGRHVMVGFFILYFFYNAYIGIGNLGVFPYHFFWEVI